MARTRPYLTLWDLLRPRAPVRVEPRPTPRRSGAMAERYEAMTRHALAAYGVRVRKWRTSMSGVAWQILYRDGTVTRLIEAPRPRGPMSAAVFLHEIGHHAIGFNTYRLRCLEEYHAWRWSLDAMERYGLTVTDAVRARMRESMDYAVAKAQRRGMRALPQEIADYLLASEHHAPRRRVTRSAR